MSIPTSLVVKIQIHAVTKVERNYQPLTQNLVLIMFQKVLIMFQEVLKWLSFVLSRLRVFVLNSTVSVYYEATG